MGRPNLGPCSASRDDDARERARLGRGAREKSPYAACGRARSFARAGDDSRGHRRVPLRVLNLTKAETAPARAVARASPRASELRLSPGRRRSGASSWTRRPRDFEDTCWRHLRVLEVDGVQATGGAGGARAAPTPRPLVSMLSSLDRDHRTPDITGCTGDAEPAARGIACRFRMKILRSARTRLRALAGRSRGARVRPRHPSLELDRARDALARSPPASPTKAFAIAPSPDIGRGDRRHAPRVPFLGARTQRFRRQGRSDGARRRRPPR